MHSHDASLFPYFRVDIFAIAKSKNVEMLYGFNTEPSPFNVLKCQNFAMLLLKYDFISCRRATIHIPLSVRYITKILINVKSQYVNKTLHVFLRTLPGNLQGPQTCACS